VELSDEVFDLIQAHCTNGDSHVKKGKFAKALMEYAAAWDLLPDPKTDWDAASWILAAIADAYFFSGNWQACCETLQKAVKGCGGAVDNPFIRLRLGQALFELGDFGEASNWMAPAYLMEGKGLFESDDSKYLTFIKSQLQPPAGGWPEGW
jgi:tetratricopeptide (TPR) repeat protein